MNISDLIAYIDTKLADNHKRLIIPSVHRDVLHYLVNGLNATVFNINSSQVTDNGDGTYAITVTNPLDDALAIDEKLNVYEYNGTNWVAKVVDLILSATGDDGVEIDDSDPNSIVVKLTQATLDSLALANSALQPGDLPPPQDLQANTDVGNTTTNPVKFRNDGTSVTGYNTYELAHQAVNGTGAIVIRFPNAPASTVKFEISLSSYYISTTPARNLTYHVWGRTDPGNGWDALRYTAGVVGSAWRPNDSFDDPVPSLRFATDGNGDPAIIIGDTSSSFRFTHISITRLESVMNNEITDVTIELATSEAEFTSVVEATLNENIPISQTIPVADETTLSLQGSELGLKAIAGSLSKQGTVYVYDDITIDAATLSTWSNSVVEIKGVVEFTGSANLQIPGTAILRFVGGKFVANGFTGTLTMNGAKIEANPYQIFEGELNLIHGFNAGVESVFEAEYSYPEWFGAKGDGVTPDAESINKAFNLIRSGGVVLQQGKTYIVNSSILFSNNKLIGNNSTIKRYEKFSDVPITSAINIEATGTHVLTVDTAAPSYADLEIGMGVAIVNQSHLPRDSYPGLWTVKDIQGSSVTIVGNTFGSSRSAGTMSLITAFPMLRLATGTSQVENITFEGGLDLGIGAIYPLDRCYWEVHSTVQIGAGSENSTISNCVFNNSLADAIIGGGTNDVIEHCSMKHLAGSGVHLSGTYRTSIINNYIFDTNLNPLTGHNEAAIIFSRSVYEILIIDNIIDNCLCGIGDIDASDNCKVYIRGNTIKNFRLHGISGYAGVTKELITRDFIITNNRISATQDFTYPEEASKEYTPLEPRTEATGNGIHLTSVPGGNWENLIISNNILEDCGIEVNNANWVAINDNVINIQHTFIASVPSDIIKVSDSKGIMNANVIKSNTPSKTNCFVLTNSKVSTKNNAYDLTNCTLSDAAYPLLVDNVDIS